jgi:lactoylglutathione lyase
MFQPVLELTHNHGTENDDNFKHCNGNEEGKKGFGHIGFVVDDVYKACDGIREMGYGFHKVRAFFLEMSGSESTFVFRSNRHYVF